MNEKIPMEKTIGAFIKLAESGTKEGWGEIDSDLPKYCDSPEFLNWAKQNTKNPNAELRDLSATIMEASNKEISGEDIGNLAQLMRENDPENPYPSFRAACALAKRAVNEAVAPLQSEIREKMEQFIEDENSDVAEIAKSYLGNLPK